MSSQSRTIRQKIIRDIPLVLVVDDNYDNIAYACGSLDILNYQYLAAQDGKAAMDIAIDKLPDLILLDIVMPEISGITIARTLKRNPLTDHIPIIAVTGLAFSHQKKQVMDSGCDDYLCKPYLIEHLEEKIARFLSCDRANSYVYDQ